MTLVFLALLTFQCSKEPIQEEQIAPRTLNDNIVQLTSAQMKNADIVMGKPIVRAMSTTIRINGVVDVAPTNRVYVSNPFGGFVKQIDLLPGSRIKRGELLVVMEDPLYIQMQQDYLMSKTRLRFLQLDYERQQNLNSDKSISDKAFQQTSSEYAVRRSW